MNDHRDEEERLRLVTLQNAQSIFLARQRAEEDLIRTKEALWKQSEWLRVTLASIGDAVVTTDAEGRVLSLNAVAETLTGWSEREAQGRPLVEVFRIIDEKTRQPVADPAERALRERRIVGLANHTILVGRDGKETPIDDSAAPIRDESDRIYGAVLIFRSIAERRRAEHALQDSEHELSDFFENASVALHWVGPDGTIIRANRAELDLLGYSREEYVGRNIAEFHVDQETIADILRRLAAGETLRGEETRMRCKDGSIKYVLIDSSVRWEDGRFIHTRCFTRDITDKKRAEQDQARLAAIVESSRDAIISKTLDGHITSWNAAAEQLFGYRADEIIGQPITVIFPPEKYSEEAVILQRLRRGERIDHYETVRVAKDGRRIDVSVTISPIRDGSGRIIGVSKISRDITARKRTEQRLATQNSVTQNLAESATLVEAAPKILRDICETLQWQVGSLWYVDEQENVLRCADMYHVPSIDIPQFEADSRQRTFAPGIGLPGRVWTSGKAQWVPDVTRDSGFTRAPLAAAAGLHGALGCPIAVNNEVLGVVEFFSREIREPDADLLSMMTAVGSQIGQFIERRRAEETLRRSEAQLASELAAMSRLHALSSRLLSTDDLSTALDDVLESAIATCGADFGDIQLLNPQTGTLEIAAQRGSRRDFVNPLGTVRTDDDSVYAEALCSGKPIAIEDVEHDSARELHRTLAAGVCRAVRSTPLKTHRGSILGMLSVYFTTPHRLSERDARFLDLYARHAADLIGRFRVEESLKEADRRKDEFLAILAHELRNPLAPIRNAVEIFRRKSLPASEIAWATDVMDRQVRQMTRLVDDLLDVSRISCGKIELRKEIVDLGEVVNNAIEASRPIMEKRRHELMVKLPPCSAHLEADATRLSQVFLNLLNNAAKYTDPGGRIEFTAEPDPDDEAALVVRVKDNGIGIPPEMLPRVFDLFAQADRSTERAEGGLGIGLTLVKRLVALHGGTIEAYSNGPATGSEFVVRLPLATGIHGRNPRLRNQTMSGRPGRRILVVDDNRDAAESLGNLLGLLGNEVHLAHDGLEAVSIAATSQPEVVFLDIGLPKMNGYEAARQIRQQPCGASMLLVAVTGWGQEDDRRRSREAGFDYHLTKPVEFAALQKLLGEARVGKTNPL